MIWNILMKKAALCHFGEAEIKSIITTLDVIYVKLTIPENFCCKKNIKSQIISSSVFVYEINFLKKMEKLTNIRKQRSENRSFFTVRLVTVTVEGAVYTGHTQRSQGGTYLPTTPPRFTPSLSLSLVLSFVKSTVSSWKKRERETEKGNWINELSTETRSAKIADRAKK